MMKKISIAVLLTLSLIILSGCFVEGEIDIDEGTGYRGVIANESSYNLRIKMVDVDRGKTVSIFTLRPGERNHMRLRSGNYRVESVYEGTSDRFTNRNLNNVGASERREWDGRFYYWYCIFEDTRRSVAHP